MESGPVSASRLYRVGNNKANWLWEAAIVVLSEYNMARFEAITIHVQIRRVSVFSNLLGSFPSGFGPMFASLLLSPTNSVLADHTIDLDSIFEMLKGLSKETQN